MHDAPPVSRNDSRPLYVLSVGLASRLGSALTTLVNNSEYAMNAIVVWFIRFPFRFAHPITFVRQTQMHLTDSCRLKLAG